MKIELYAAPETPELRIPDDPGIDMKAEIERLISAMEKMEPQHLHEQVYTQLKIDLCQKCRDELLPRLKKIQNL